MIDYKALFEMKQDDWIEVCGEVDKLKEELKREREAVDLFSKVTTIPSASHARGHAIETQKQRKVVL